MQGFRGAIPEHPGPQRHLIHFQQKLCTTADFSAMPNKVRSSVAAVVLLGLSRRGGWAGCWLRRGTGWPFGPWVSC